MKTKIYYFCTFKDKSFYYSLLVEVPLYIKQQVKTWIAAGYNKSEMILQYC